MVEIHPWSTLLHRTTSGGPVRSRRKWMVKIEWSQYISTKATLESALVVPANPSHGPRCLQPEYQDAHETHVTTTSTTFRSKHKEMSHLLTKTQKLFWCVLWDGKFEQFCSNGKAPWIDWIICALGILPWTSRKNSIITHQVAITPPSTKWFCGEKLAAVILESGGLHV